MADMMGNQRAPQPHMSTLLRHRNISYKIGIFTLIGAFALFVLGFSTSNWIKHIKYREINLDDSLLSPYAWSQEINWGLWDAPCHLVESSCNTALTIAQVLFCVHLLGYIVCLIVAAYENFTNVDIHSYFSRKLEICVLATAVVGTAGEILFIVWYSNSFVNNGFMWSLAVTSLALTSLFITFFCLFCGNRRNLTPGIVFTTQPTSNYVHYQPAPLYGTSVVQTYGPAQPVPPMQYGPQSQPLLPPSQPYPYPHVSQPQGAPPAYSLPPAYSASPAPGPMGAQGPSYPYYPPQPQCEKDSYAMASAPPREEDTLPRRN